MHRSTARRATHTVLLTLGAVLLAPLVLLGALYLGTLAALIIADVIYSLTTR